MAVQKKDLPSDLTLELAGELSPGQFLKASRAFFKLVAELAQDDSAEPIEWVVQVMHGSNLVGLLPAPKSSVTRTTSVRKRVERALRYSAQGKLDRAELTTKAREYLRELAELSGTEENPGPVRRMWFSEKPVDVTPAIVRYLDEESASEYDDLGTIEGRLEAIAERGGVFKITLNDAVLKQIVECRFPEELLPKALAAFRKRVEVTGSITYSKHHVPLRVAVASLEEMPDDSTLPSLIALRGTWAAKRKAAR